LAGLGAAGRTAGEALHVGLAVSFWREAHELAVSREWEQVVDRELPKGPAGKRSALVALGPVAALAPVPPDSEIDEQMRLLLTKLKRPAEKITRRRTVFLLPEDEQEIERLAKRAGCSVQAMVEALSQQLHQLLENGQADDFTFVRVGPVGARAGLLDKMIEDLHSRFAAAVLEHEKISRPGPVLFVGQTGTGKTYGARLLAKKMGKDNFIPVNLSAVADTTLESRIRGYVEGAFTNAKRGGSASWFERADGGILFLDEFQSVPEAYQTQLLDLLHAVSDRVSVARMGDDDQAHPYHVKVILAVNEDLHMLLNSGKLRQDLFYRMRHLVHFDPLHKRFAAPRGQLELAMLLKTYRWRLAPVIEPGGQEAAGEELSKARLREMFPQIEPDACQRLLEHRWPGNLRELERVASDLFSDCDHKLDETPISREQVDDAIKKFDVAVSLEVPSPAVQGERSAAPTNPVLSGVEEALRGGGFVIGRALERLATTHPMYTLRSRRSLRRFLNENVESLSADVRSHPKVLRFMRPRREVPREAAPAPSR
jgi:transcriptional regulator with AAA-type ATPase domain